MKSHAQPPPLPTGACLRPPPLPREARGSAIVTGSPEQQLPPPLPVEARGSGIVARSPEQQLPRPGFHADQGLGRKWIPIVGDNLVYLFGVAFLSWEVFDILLLVWIENLVLGVFGLLRLLLGRRPDFARRLHAAVFYVMGLGVFSLMFGLFAWVEFSGLNVPGNREASLLAMKQVLLQPQVLIASSVLAGLQLWDFVVGYLGSGRFRWIDAEWEMRHVGIRMVILTVGLMVGGGWARKCGMLWPMLVLLVILKTGIELGFVWNDRMLEAQAGITTGGR